MKQVCLCLVIILLLAGCQYHVDPQPTAVFSWSAGVNPGLITFINKSKDATTYQWAFGEGQTSTSADPSVSYTYTKNGTYSVTLVAKGPGGESTAIQSINVASLPTTGSVIFWLDYDAKSNTDISVNGKLVGTITRYISSGGSPSCGLQGCVTVTLPEGEYPYTAQTQATNTAKWSGTIRVMNGQCKSMQLTK